MSRRYDSSNIEERAAGLADAASAIRAGELVVIPTDTVYGIGADAFTPSAVAALLEAKGRGRDMPVPVLVGTVRAAGALVEDLGTHGQDLIDSFWPGPLTLVCRASRSLNWDLGDSKGTVAVRMPLHAITLELLKETGPMAVSSANRSGAPPATTAANAEEQLGESVAVYLDGGACADSTPSTIIDLTTPVPRVLRKGAISVEKLRSVIGYVATDADPEEELDLKKSGPATETDQTDLSDKTDLPAKTDLSDKTDLADKADQADKPAETDQVVEEAPIVKTAPADDIRPSGAPETSENPEKLADAETPEKLADAEKPETAETAEKLEKPETADKGDKPVAVDPVDKVGGAGVADSARSNGSGTADATRKDG
ncbi:L-threonylcarbamoyladenylate synthase [Sphaerisporangium sp. NBC_01403]|uniref:L-threonylcarbamoyladenylate synthase n=1 Tax=Sphaerisporangium sp. NBC_01403 TaxID=2903599 RepID=UPI00386EC2AD